MSKFGAKAKQLTSWSYSRYALYTECPAKAKYKFIDKLPEPPAPAMERGNKIHKLAEDYTKGLIKKLPPELKLYKHEFEILKNSKPVVEESWCFKNDWSETVWNDWAGCWVRIKVDAGCLDEQDLYVIDHKTGKPREGYEEQLSLYALAGMLKYPHIKQVHTQLWYLDHAQDPVAMTYDIKQREDLRKDWEKRVSPMLNDTRFTPKPSYKCQYCAFSKAKGGPCKF